MTRISLCLIAIAETLETLEHLKQSFTAEQDKVIARLERSDESSANQHHELDFQIAQFYPNSEIPHAPGGYCVYTNSLQFTIDLGLLYSNPI